ncbi:MAG: carbohydrate binding family 9 domain-containing protein, partial [bacterium]
MVIDGRLNDLAWSLAQPTAGFLQSYPAPKAEATAPTEVRVLYDDEALYVGVRLFDSHPDSIAAPLARRDPTGVYTDWVHVMIDSYHDRRTAFAFSVTPASVKRDALEY